ncbi:antitoxin [Microbacterium sp. P07]|uniref:FitA-like ribbon-helix-helix domain-containing protein n=1 Tax=Microbacterium sp. P07 TaxID=3366952 RepID=UPI00374702FA
MPNVLVRDLPDPVHAALLARAAGEGRSLQQYLTAELTRLASRPTNAELFDRIQGRAERAGVSAADILNEVRSGRDRAQ